MVDDTNTEAGAAEWRQAKERRGVVVKASTAKTVTVEVTRRVTHGEYGKILTRSKKYAVHDLVGCKVGDEVVIRETRPISKTKRWRVVERIAPSHGGAA